MWTTVKTKILVLLAVCLMMTGMLAMNVFADGNVAKIDDTEYATLADAIDAAEQMENPTVELLQDISLAQRVDVEASMTIDLGGRTIKPQSTAANGSAFNIKSGTVKILNGTIDGTEVTEVETATADNAVTIANGICLVTVRSGAGLVLEDEDLTMIVSSKNGCCVYPFNGGRVDISAGIFKNLTEEDYQWKDGFKGLTVNQANVADQLLFITGGNFYGNDPRLGDDNGAVFLPEHYKSIYNETEGCYQPIHVDPIPAPTGLTWGSEYIHTMGIWDRYTDYSDFEKFVVTGKYEKAGEDPVTESFDVAVPEDGYDFDDFIAEHGSGTYSFSVQAIAKQNAAAEDSATSWSGTQVFRELAVTIDTLDTDGETELTKAGGAGYVEAVLGEKELGGQQVDDGDKLYYPDSSEITFQSNPDMWYQLKSASFTPEPADLVVNGKTASFTLNGDVNAAITFQKNTETVDIPVRFGDKHAALADKIKTAIEEDGSYQASVEGSVLTVTWPVASQAGDVTDYVGDMIYEELGGESPMSELSDEGEMYYSMSGLALKEMTGYASYDELEEERKALADQDVQSGLAFYVCWEVSAQKADFTVATPKCGQVVKAVQDEEGWHQENAPSVETIEGSQLAVEKSVWVLTDGERVQQFEGTIEGGSSYTAYLFISGIPGYYIDPEALPAITVNGETVSLTVSPYGADLEVELTAEHDWDDGEIIKVTNPEEGYVKIFHCKNQDCYATKTEDAAPIAMITETGSYYEDLGDAQTAIMAGQTMQLITDVDLGSGWFYMQKTFTFDLNGHTITSSGNMTLWSAAASSSNWGDVTITDSSADGTGVIKNTKSSYSSGDKPAAIRVDATLTVEGGTVDGGWCGIWLARGDTRSTVKINAGTIKGGHESVSFANGKSFTLSGGRYSDDIGNGDKFTRTDGKTLFYNATDKYYHLTTPVTVSFEEGDRGDGTMSSEEVGLGLGYTLPDSDFTSTDDEYAFKEWEVPVAGSDPVGKKPGEVIIVTADTTVTAIWTDDCWIVSFDADGKSTDQMDPIRVAKGNQVKLPENGFTSTTHNFKNWIIDSTEYSVGDKADITGNTTAYANWTAKTWGIQVQARTITGDNCTDVLGDDRGSVTFNPVTNTLTLTNATIELAGVASTTIEAGIRIAMKDSYYKQHPLNIELVGENKIINTEINQSKTQQHGIISVQGVTADVIFTGSGSLDISFEASTNRQHWGIYSRTNTTIDGPSININIPGSYHTRGQEIIGAYDLILKNGASYTIATGGHQSTYGLAGSTVKDPNFSMEAGCTLEVRSEHQAVINTHITGETAALGALVSLDTNPDNGVIWDKEQDLASYKYILFPYSTDKTALNNAITAAADAKTGIAVSEDGKDLQDGTVYTTQAEKNALDAAIVTAQEVSGDSAINQKKIDDAKTAITTATEIYNAAKKTATVDRGALNEAIQAAQSAETGVKISEDGGDVEKSDQWTTPAERQAMDDAIAAAQEAADDPTASQNDIEKAESAIKVATNVFNSAKKAGTKPNGTDPDQKGSDGTPVGPGASAQAAENAIMNAMSDADPRGSKFAPIKLKSTKQGKSNIKLTWSKASGAVRYVIYGNASGKKNKMKKLATTAAKRLNVKKIRKKLKKATYHKFIVVALDKDGVVVSTSKIIHVATKGNLRKAANPKGVVVKAKVNKNGRKLKRWKKTGAVAVGAGKTVRLKGSYTKARRSRVKKRAAIRYESSDVNIATVTAKGSIRGKTKGSCYVYVYAQNGVWKRIRVKVK